MKKGQLIIISSIIFFVCSSMSKCNTPAPETSVHGIVTDTATGKPVGGIQINVYYLGGVPNDMRYSPVTTNADGSYSLSFKPFDGYTYYSVAPAENSSYFAPAYGGPQLILGKDNDINLKVYKLVDVTVNLKSTIDQNQPKLEVSFSAANLAFGAHYFSSAIVDTVFHAYVPRLNNFNISGIYINPANNGGATTNAFSSTIYVGSTDTTINITNP